MTDNNHPITPPPELVQQWWDGTHGAFYEFEAVATQAARWGWSQCMKLDHAWLEAKMQEAKDEELEACCAWVDANFGQEFAQNLRLLHRPKPPSLKEQALEAFRFIGSCHSLGGPDWAIIHRALETLDD